MFDIETLRFTLGVLSCLVLVLFYAGVYRPTRSSFAGWWSLALLSSAVSPALLLLNGTDAQVIANPLSSLITTVGGASVWFATRSVRGLAPVPWVVYVTPALVFVVAMFEDPATNRWAGNGTLYFLMGLFFSLGAREMWLAWKARRLSPDWDHDGEARVALIVSALAASVLATFYVWRFILYVTLGHEHPLFETTVGGGPTAVVLMVSLMAVTFSAAALGYDEQTRELRRRVALDDLTGLLARSAFFERASVAIAKQRSDDHPRVLVVADLDHFKVINDTYGHAAGDRALELFASVVRIELEPSELAGRLGGEEFALLLCVDSEEEARSRLHHLGAKYLKMGGAAEVHVPTVSFGVASTAVGSPIEMTLAQADRAMYQAKAAGRNRVVISATP
ncbi:GGDEF domain-containing protein [Demequina aurantiaca]|uniref:GGDEF domain-containing protein n=1 Tax=Demequina aurantiaca TaxID=676200 RepID=UPI000784E159|nr:GGDEF domain-containing protein [Demequina aurantiaca]